MATSYTPLLGLALPVQGELSGTWGDTVNNYITSYLDASVAGALTVTGNTTLTKTTNSSLGATSSQYAIIIASPTSANITITAPAASKTYVVINTSATYTVTFRGTGPTTGVTVGVSDRAFIAWNGSDFVRVNVAVGGSNTQVQYNSSGNLAGSANMTFDGTKLTVGNILNSGLTASKPVFTDASKNLVSTGTLGADQGGTGLATLAANNVLLGNGTSALQVVAPGTLGNVLTSDGTTWASTAPTSAPTNFQEFTSSGTWTRPAGTIFVYVECWGGGGGGGSGGSGSGGGGGGGGARTYLMFKASSLGATVAVTVGAGGTGGAAISSIGNGNQGTAGGDTTFGTHLASYGGRGGPAGQQNASSSVLGVNGGGSGGTSSPSSNVNPALGGAIGSYVSRAIPGSTEWGGGAGGGWYYNSPDPGSSFASGGASSLFAGAGGGLGGGTVMPGYRQEGYAGGATQKYGADLGPAGGGIGLPGTNGTQSASGSGSGGGGGGSNTTSPGGAGGNGGNGGGGGGGGGAQLGSPGNSGAGGTGGNGLVRVYTW